MNPVATNTDFLACSSYKFFGPHQGILYGKREQLLRLRPYKLRVCSEKLPDRWETGTQNHECMAGVTAAIDYIAEVAIKETKKNGVFVVPGIGRLVKSNRKARVGRNPQTGEAIKIPAKTVVKFRVAKAVKDTIAPPKK